MFRCVPCGSVAVALSAGIVVDGGVENWNLPTIHSTTARRNKKRNREPGKELSESDKMKYICPYVLARFVFVLTLDNSVNMIPEKMPISYQHD